MNCVNAHIASEPCNFKFILWDDTGIGCPPGIGIQITVDGIDYGFVTLPWETAYTEEIVALPSGEVQLFWIGIFSIRYHFEIYNALDELIYTCTELLPGGLFFTYQNECPDDNDCLPITDFEGIYISEEHQVKLSWKAPESNDLTGFDIFRNDSLVAHVDATTIFYSDNTVELETGDYKYCVVPIYPYACDLEDECREIPIYVGIKNYASTIDIYPNPADNIVNISGADISNVKVFNNIGQLILNQHNTNIINVSKLTNGIYLLSIETTTKQITQKKLIINH
jgi:hypothetical protein